MCKIYFFPGKVDPKTLLTVYRAVKIKGNFRPRVIKHKSKSNIVDLDSYRWKPLDV